MPIPRFCPNCGGPVRAIGISTGHCAACDGECYANSKPAAGVFATRGDTLLLVRRARPPAAGKWDIPGGFLEEGEHPEVGVRRELLEELSIELGELRLADCSINPIGPEGVDGAVLDIFFECELPPESHPRASDDVDAFVFVPIATLPELPEGEWAFAANQEAALRFRERFDARRGSS